MNGWLVVPKSGTAGEVPICPAHLEGMRPVVVRMFDARLTELWWVCKRGCRTAHVPLPPGAVPNLGPPIPANAVR